MMNRLASYAVAAIVMVALLAGCTTGAENQAGLAGTGSTAGPASPGPALRSPPSPPVPRVLAAHGVADRVFFALDRSDLSAEARGTVERWAAWLRQYPTAGLTIEGHCDERGTREYNLGLGERRAAAARDHLVSLGVDARRLTTVSYGKERPAVVGSAEAAWAQNRRAVAVVSPWQ